MKKIHLACQYFLNHDLEEKELRRQVKELADAGYQSIYGHARQGLITPYFSRKYWDCIRIIVDECQKNGVKFAIWDEDCFPSGSAGNRIIWDHPELSAKRLNFSVFEVKNGERVYKVLPIETTVLRCFAVHDDGKIEDITGYCGSIRGEVTWRQLTHIPYSKVNKVGLPHWRAGWRGRKFAIDYNSSFDGKIVAVQLANYEKNPDVLNNTDLLNPETTRLLIQLTHQEFEKQCGADAVRNTFDASFLDEPNAGVYCWSTHFAEEFQKQHGFDITDNLAHIVLDIDDRSLFIRHCYRMTQQKLITENYLGQIREWCRARGITSTGHLSRSESLANSNGFAWPNEMKCYSFMDIPCTDPLGAGEAWQDASAYHTGIKVAASVAEIYNKPQAGADTLAVLGHEAAIRDLAFHLDYQMTLGLTYFNIHGLSYSLAGDRKDEVPPSIFYQHSEWKWMKYFLERTGNLCDILNRGERRCQTAMLYPCATFYCTPFPPDAVQWEKDIHDMTEKMLSHQKDFTFVDEDAICRFMADDAEKFITRYPCFVVPPLQYLPRPTADALEAYAAKGGKLMVTGSLPILFGPALDSGTALWENGKKFIVTDFIDQLPGAEITGEGARDILLQQRIIDGKDVTFFFNRSEKAFNGKFNGKTIYLAPNCGTLLRDGESLMPPDTDMTEITGLDRWDIEFPENHLALAGWEFPGERDPNIKEIASLITRKIPRTSEPNPVIKNTFLYSGECKKMEFIIEKDDLDKGLKCLVNDVELTDFYPANFSDNCFVCADITNLINCGSTPKLNRITFIPQPGTAAPEVPFLRGRFRASFRHADKTMPFLTGFDGVLENQPLQVWSEYGYGNFSGAILYRTRIKLDTSGIYKLDLGKVEDLAEVVIDGKKFDVLFRQPYVTGEIPLEAGVHTLEITIANAPGNRDRLAGLPAGMTGPVRLLRK